MSFRQIFYKKLTQGVALRHNAPYFIIILLCLSPEHLNFIRQGQTSGAYLMVA
jgi:hypothetical protein